MTLLAPLLAASLFAAQQSSVTPSEPEAALASAAQTDPMTATVGGIVQALKGDESIARAYFLRKPSDDGAMIFVLVPIFDKKYPEEAISASYKVFGQNMPQEAKLELFLVPKRDYKKYFSQVEPIYIRP